MKNKYLIAIICSLFSNFIFGQSVIESQTTFQIPASTIRGNGFTYNLSNSDTALAYIRNVILQREEVRTNADYSNFKTDNLEKSAIIFLRHQLDPKALLIDKTESDLDCLETDINRVKLADDNLQKELKAIDSFLLLLKYKNSISETEYDHMIALLDQGPDAAILKLGKNDIMKNPKIKEILSVILENRKNVLEKEHKDNIIFKNSADAYFKEEKEIVKQILHKRNQKFSEYLLGTKKILIVILGGENDLQKAEISIKHNKTFFTQSFEDLRTAISTLKGVSIQLPCKIILIKEKEIKPPSDLIIKHDSLKQDIVFTIHERNIASFQVGVINNKFSLNNFSISNGNLVVKPDSIQKSQWKSNLYASLEMHIPRDIDNFQPIYKTIFKGTDTGRTFGRWLYDITLSRIGIYGGFKISDDPLSSIHAGFNYAISKEVYVNFGWTWNNQVEPQVTAIGNISSLSDAVKYAKRKYSKGEFSWGLSFAPSALIETLGLKKDNKSPKANDK